MQNKSMDNDLQKAIDDITNNTNSDPVFGNPIAAPAPMPEPISEPAPVPAPMPELPEDKPVESAKPFPTVGATPITSTFNPAPMSAPAPAPIAPAPVPTPEPVQEVTKETYTETEIATAPEELHDVKEKILRDLAPMVDKINVSPSEKFNLYKDIHEKLHDDSVITSAYEVSKEITDEGERADALLYLYDSLK